MWSRATRRQVLLGGCEGEVVSRPPSCECRPRSTALLSARLSWLTRAERALRRARSQQPRYGAVSRTVPRPPAAGREVRNRGVLEDDLRVRSTACRARSVRCARAEGDRAAVLVAVARSSRLDIGMLRRQVDAARRPRTALQGVRDGPADARRAGERWRAARGGRGRQLRSEQRRRQRYRRSLSEKTLCAARSQRFLAKRIRTLAFPLTILLV